MKYPRYLLRVIPIKDIEEGVRKDWRAFFDHSEGQTYEGYRAGRKIR